MDSQDNATPQRAADPDHPKNSGKPEATDEEVAHAHDGAIPEEKVEEARAHEETRAERDD